MEQIVDVEVEPRVPGNKGDARKLRATGLIPGIMYGHKEKPLPFSVEPISFTRKMRKTGYGRNTVIRVHGLEREVLAVLKQTQMDPVRRDLVHLDLIEVREDEFIEVKVPIHTEGKCRGVTAGGSLQIVRRDVMLKCIPASIPKEVMVDTTDLDIGDTVHLGDLKLPEGAELASPEGWGVLSIHAPKAQATTDEAEATADDAAAAAPAADAAK